ncbi:helix-turn-helix domain-containing protein [Paremcibacter congregatus]|uniref:Helix-turn-helix domain-containing protein n=1 Tax=Paremcibacter congregatus TaxID=2043170 RepID=A0A2G4YWK8_9PROT|nr:helix-turn-helix domain-containing protein [Paremcibacter congregatus]PHZ86727.1 hypothetical protein CRD36_00295 [Paremcibacter congregatus]QDE27621.1 helix-turn-helix domain-containing protein [Paremcibacter congregatus]
MTEETKILSSLMVGNLYGYSLEDNTPYLTVAQAAARLKVKPETLDKWRQQSQGPLFRQHGRRIVYHLHDLDCWSEGQKQQTARRYRAADDGPNMTSSDIEPDEGLDIGLGSKPPDIGPKTGPDEGGEAT